ncbi:MAG: hypothetical protein H6733_02165 [Alphaproteobacteria bacterium]|nr:hypothetical protein [Alphaproteobacteria bacterium]
MAQPPSSGIELTVTGVVPEGVVATAAAGGAWVLRPRPGPDTLGPWATELGVVHVGPYRPTVTLWEVVTAHPDGVPADAAVALLLRLAAASGLEAVDPDAVHVDAEGRIVEAAPCLSGLDRAALVAALFRGEVPAGEPGALESALAAAPDGATVGPLPGGAAPDHDALRAAIARAMPQVAAHPLAGTVLTVGAPPVPRAAPKVVVARVAALTLVLGLVAGWVLARPAPATGGAAPQATVRVWCAPGTTSSTGASSRCTLQVWDGVRWRVAQVDTHATGLYDCRVREGGIACDEG